MSEDLRPVNSRTGEPLDIPLIDDLADVLSVVVVGWSPIVGADLAQLPSVVRVMARYRAYKANQPKPFMEADPPMNDKLAPAKSKFTKLGVKYRLVGTGKGRWSEGKVHLQFWSRDWKQWVLTCRPSQGISAYYTHDVDDLSTPITCKTCMKKDPRDPGR